MAPRPVSETVGPPRPFERRTTPRYDPIDDEEVAAFKRALGAVRLAATAGGNTDAGSVPADAEPAYPGRRLTLGVAGGTPARRRDDPPASPGDRPQELSATQYGELE